MFSCPGQSDKIWVTQTTTAAFAPFPNLQFLPLWFSPFLLLCSPLIQFLRLC